MAWIVWSALAVAPKLNAPAWVFDRFYSGVTVGWFDGSNWHTFETGDDCQVTHWQALAYPDPPWESD